jgi:hypothetical protein
VCDTAEQDIADEMGVDVETLFDDDFQDRDGDDGDDGDDNDDDDGNGDGDNSTIVDIQEMIESVR